MILSLREVSIRIGPRQILHDVSMDVEPGETVALMGPNGAGKTTLLRCILGLLHYEGRIEVDGFDVRRRGVEARRRIGYVPQQPAFDAMTAREALHFLARLRGVPPERGDDALRRVGLEAEGDRRISVFSGGMQQRLSVAAALVGDPPVLLLDEATANLDPAGRGELLDLLAGFKRAGKTLLLSSHRRSEVRSLADRVVVLQDGRISRDGRPENVLPPDRVAVSVEAHGPEEKRRISAWLEGPQVATLPTWNGTFDALVPADRVASVVDRLRAEGIELPRIRIRTLEEGGDA